MEYPRNLIETIYGNCLVQDYLNDYNYDAVFPDLCKEAKLTDKHVETIISRFKNKETLQSIANRIGCTKEYVRILQNTGLIKLQETLRKHIVVTVLKESPIEDLNLTSRAIKKLHDIGIHTVEQFIKYPIEDFKNVKSIGVGILTDILIAYTAAKYTVKDDSSIAAGIKNIMKNYNLTKEDIMRIVESI